MRAKTRVLSILPAVTLFLAAAESMAGSINLTNQAQTGALPPGASVDYMVKSGSGRALLVCEYTLNDTAQAPTYNGTSLTFVAKSTYLGVARLGVAAYVLLAPDEGTYPLILNGTETINASIISFTGIGGVDGASSAQASDTITITDNVTATQPNDFLAMCETDSGASDDSWAHSTYYGTVFMTASGLSLGGRIALGSGSPSMSIRAGKGNPPLPSYLADVLVSLKAAP